MSSVPQIGIAELSEIEALWRSFSSKMKTTSDYDLASFMQEHPTHADDIGRLFPLLQDLGDLSLPDMPNQIGKYEIIRQIGMGGMGVVYECKSETLRERIALKVIEPTRIEASGKTRFEREARVAATLHHSNIVPVYDFGYEDTQPYYTMRFIDGPNLSDVLHEEWTCEDIVCTDAPLAGQMCKHLSENWEQQVHIAKQVLDALEHAHEKGVLHRDVKPANLLLDESYHVWVVDFGLATQRFDKQRSTAQSKVLGTPRYMAPEQIRGEADERSDIFGLGLVLYELAILQFGEERARKPIWKGGLRPIAEVNPTIPSAYAAAIQKAVSLDPMQRFQSATEMKQAIQRLHLTELQEKTDVTKRTRKTSGKSLAAVFLLCIIAAAWFGEELHRLVAVVAGAAPQRAVECRVVEGEATVTSLAHHSISDSITLAGADRAQFFVNDELELCFRSVPDFELPHDSNFDNTYNVVMRDEHSFQAFNIIIEDANEAPRFAHPMQGDSSEITIARHERNNAFALSVEDDRDSQFAGMCVSLADDRIRRSIGMTPLGIFVLLNPTDNTQTISMPVRVSDRTDINFARVEERDGRLVLFEERITAGMKLQVQGRIPLPLRRDLIDIATDDGDTYFHIHADGVGTASLFRSSRAEQGWTTELQHADCGIPQSAIGFSTLDGSEFRFCVSDPDSKCVSLYAAELSNDGTFRSQILSADCSISHRIGGMSWLDSNRFQHIRLSPTGMSRFYFSFLSNTQLISVPLRHGGNDYATPCRGQAAWKSIDKASQHSTRTFTVRLTESE